MGFGTGRIHGEIFSEAGRSEDNHRSGPGETRKVAEIILPLSRKENKQRTSNGIIRIMIDIQKACDRLNEAISEKKEGFLDVVNLIMNQIYQEGGGLYWDRDIFIDCNGEDERLRHLVRKSDKVFFEPSDDPGEHPGVVVRYKRLHKYYIGDMFREKENPGNFWVITDILPDIHGSIYILAQ